MTRPAANRFEAEARADKVLALTRAIDRTAQQQGYTTAETQAQLERFGNSEWFELARMLGINPPSETTVREVLAQYGSGR